MKASRAAGPAHRRQDQLEPENLVWPATAPPGGGVEDSSDRVVAYRYAEQENESVPFSEHGARGPVDGDLSRRHQIGAWMIVEGRGNNRGKG